MSEAVERREKVRVSEQDGVERREEFVKDVGLERRQAVARISNLIWLVGGLVEALLGLRVLLKLIAANPGNAFARLIYQITDPLAAPFLSLTSSPSSGDMVLEFSTLIAMLAYGLAAWAIVQLIWVVFAPGKARRTAVYQHERK